MTLSGPRVVAVLGYSDGGAGELHPICAARLARAAEIATVEDVVVLSGWARVPGTRSEAELMRDNWPGVAGRVILDDDARTTAENAAHVASIARDLDAGEVVVVTSDWHAPRATAAFRWLARRSRIHVATASPSGGSGGSGGSGRDRLRELGLWLLLPAQLLAVRRPRG